MRFLRDHLIISSIILAAAALAAALLGTKTIKVHIDFSGGDKTSKVPTTEPAKPPTTTGTTTSTNPPPPRQTYLADVLNGLDTIHSHSADFRKDERTVSVAGPKRFLHATIVDVDLAYGPIELQVPVGGYARLQVRAAGLEIHADVHDRATLEMYADHVAPATKLWSGNFRDPSVVKPIDVPLRGANTLLLEWSGPVNPAESPVQFVMGDALLQG